MSALIADLRRQTLDMAAAYHRQITAGRPLVAACELLVQRLRLAGFMANARGEVDADGITCLVVCSASPPAVIEALQAMRHATRCIDYGTSPTSIYATYAVVVEGTEVSLAVTLPRAHELQEAA